MNALAILTISIAVGGIGVVFGLIYPAVMVLIYKLCGSKLTVLEILRRI